jgi:hypothetical protein
MSNFRAEYSHMSAVEFTQYALRNHVAPPSLGSVKTRIRHASRRLGWNASRTRDCWYAYPRVSINADELRKLEETTGLHYGRQELKEIDAYIARAEALLAGQDEAFHRPFIAAMRAFFGALDRTGTEG